MHLLSKNYIKLSIDKYDDNPKNLIFQTQISVREILLLNDHLKELENIFDFSSTSQNNDDSTDEEDKLSLQIIRFCRNLDTIESTVKKMANRLSMIDDQTTSMHSIFRKFFSVSYLNNNYNIVNVNRIILWIFVLIIIFIFLFFLFPHESARQFQAIFTIFILIFFLSIYQFYNNEYREHVKKLQQSNQLQYQQQSHLNCSFGIKIHHLFTTGDFKCPNSKTTNQFNKINNNNDNYDDYDDFYEHFNLLEFLSKYLVTIILSPLKQFSRGIMQLFEELLDGEASEDIMNIGAWFRSIVFSNILRPIFIILIIYISIKLSFFFNMIKFTHFIFNQFFDGIQEENRQPVVSTSNSSQIDRNHHHSMIIQTFNYNLNDATSDKSKSTSLSLLIYLILFIII